MLGAHTETIRATGCSHVMPSMALTLPTRGLVIRKLRQAGSLILLEVLCIENRSHRFLALVSLEIFGVYILELLRWTNCFMRASEEEHSQWDPNPQSSKERRNSSSGHAKEPCELLSCWIKDGSSITNHAHGRCPGASYGCRRIVEHHDA